MQKKDTKSTRRRISSPAPSPQNDMFFRLLVESLDGYAVFTTDTQGTINSWNSGAEKLLGYQGRDILGKDISIIYIPEDRGKNASRKEMQHALIKGRAADERWHVRKDGSRFWGSGLVFPLRSEAGVIIGFTKILRNLTERKQANEALRFSNEILAHITESVIVTDMSGKITYWNKGATRTFGYTEQEMLTQTPAILYPTVNFRKLLRDLRHIRYGNDYVGEWKGRHKNGSEIILDIHTSLMRNTEGGPIGYIGIAKDITEKKLVEESIKQKEEQYRAFVQNSTEGIWRFELERPIDITLPVNKQIDRIYKYAYLAECNDSMAQMYGLDKADDIIGMRLGDLLVRSDQRNIEYLKAFITSGYRLNEVESHERDSDGNEKIFLNNLVGIVENGSIYRAWGTQRDITEQKKIMESQIQLARIVESSEDAILSRTFDGTILSWNLGAEKIFGYTAAEVLGKNVSMFVPAGREDEIDKIHEITKKGTHMNHFETVRLKKDRQPVHVSISLSPIPNSAGEIIGISAISRDITERIRLENQKDEFIGIASHELKTPVTSIKAYTQVMLHRFAKKGDKVSVDLLAKMDTQIDKLNHLIGDLLDVTKIESGRLQLNLGYFDFNELVRETVEEMQRTTVRHTIEMKLERTKSVCGDRDRIGQVMMNLLSNAIKYSPEANKILVTTEHDKKMITLCVRDFGVGIPREKQGHVFERFFRVSGPNQNTFPGMGLGLYISSEIIKRLGGKIWVESYKGKGSTFCFSLPLTTPTKKNSVKRTV